MTGLTAFAYPVDGNLTPIGDSADPFIQALADSCDQFSRCVHDFSHHSGHHREDTHV